MSFIMTPGEGNSLTILEDLLEPPSFSPNAMLLPLFLSVEE